MSVKFFKKNNCYYTIKTSEYADEFYSEATKKDRGCFACQFIIEKIGPFGVLEITEQLTHKKLYFDLEGNVYLSKNNKTPIFNMNTDSIN